MTRSISEGELAMAGPKVRRALVVNGVSVEPGERRRVEIPVGGLPTQTPLALPVEIVRGVEPGPRVWVSAALHGDEVNGVEIVRALLNELDPKQMCGAVIAVPIVNVFGFINQSRYLPDRRDLNRSFPGSKKGSLAGRLARLFLDEIVGCCTHGIDLHTAAVGRYNFPHVRGDLSDAPTRQLLEAFGADVMMDAAPPRGSLRQTAARKKIPIVLFEGGEALRFDRPVVEVGLAGTKRVLEALGVTTFKDAGEPGARRESSQTSWVRARRAGILRVEVESGAFVKKGQRLGTVGDAFDTSAAPLKAPFDGIVLSHVTHPLVHQGEAMFHVAKLGE
ncbi:succinylglutamate desuccinylase/aspartoacylase family protein [Lujinxingia sediminis]|nr:succinylglutamate desuccinylase/aspartoacylase family protein [Lujinxingia sediminis]